MPNATSIRTVAQNAAQVVALLPGAAGSVISDSVEMVKTTASRIIEKDYSQNLVSGVDHLPTCWTDLLVRGFIAPGFRAPGFRALGLRALGLRGIVVSLPDLGDFAL